MCSQMMTFYLQTPQTLRLILEIWQQLHLCPALISHMPRVQTRRQRSHLKRTVAKSVICLTHLEIFMLVSLLQRLLKAVNKSVLSTKFPAHSFFKYYTLVNPHAVNTSLC